MVCTASIWAIVVFEEDEWFWFWDDEDEEDGED